MTDTHFHFKTMVEKRDIDGTAFLEEYCVKNKASFALDIGTRCDDLNDRQSFLLSHAENCSDGGLGAKKAVYFSAGIWPDVDEIKNRFDAIKTLEEEIEDAKESDESFFRKVVALGECGLDRHWNVNNPDHRDESDFSPELLAAEEEMFEMQLSLAKRLNLPVIVHSRDAAEATIACIKNVGYHKGIIHCYSYGIEEAKIFLDLGWHISFSGSVTYTKKAKMDEMTELVRYVPDERILCETDSPYLAPVPHRGETNTPLYVDFVYEFVSARRGTTPGKLEKTVNENVKKLFKI